MNSWVAWRNGLTFAAAMVGVLACEEPAPATQSVAESAALTNNRGIDELRRYEAARRAQTDFSAAPPSNGRLGANPGRLTKLDDGGFAGLLEGADKLVVLDEHLEQIASTLAPRSPRGIALDPRGLIYVVGELESRVAVYNWTNSVLRLRFSILLPQVFGIRDIAVLASGRLALIEEVSGRLLEVNFEWPPAGHGPVPASVPSVLKEVARSHGPNLLRKSERWLFVNSILSHSIQAYPLGANGSVSAAPRTLTHDGPLWTFEVVERAGRIWVVAGGIENRPLDRTIGSFGNIDSFLYLYELTAQGFRSHGAFNLSALGLVTPKVLLVRQPEERSTTSVNVVVAGYASAELFELQVSLPDADAAMDGLLRAKLVGKRDAVPGLSAATWSADGALVAASPLFDLWGAVNFDSSVASVWRPAAESNVEEDAEWRLGEALFFTTLMAPNNSADGPLSRFTCETCHFEGYVDGRVHHTGRGEVRASTKPLLGLFNNRPHFSRALDKDLSRVAHAEFRVAGAGSGKDPWFAVSNEQFPWIERLGGGANKLTPLQLRRALMTFLMRFSHRTNPQSAERSQWNAEERAGAQAFEERCEKCHRAQLAADAPETRLSFEQWERWTLAANAPIVWGLAEYRKTGVLPYVHRDGARVPSLRRLYKKWPYLTNGAGLSVDDVLRQCRFWGQNSFSHAGGEGESLSPQQRAVLEAFLRLL